MTKKPFPWWILVLVAGAVLGFARSIGEFGATITFVSNVPGETQTLPLAIYAALQQPGGDSLVWRLSAISVVLSLVALIVLVLRMLLAQAVARDVEATHLRAELDQVI